MYQTFSETISFFGLILFLWWLSAAVGSHLWSTMGQMVAEVEKIVVMGAKTLGVIWVVGTIIMVTV